MAAVIFPWPARAERKARVAVARRGAEEAAIKRDASRSLTADIQRLRARNHVSEALDAMIAKKARERGQQ
jgi:hypothetical protein